MGSIIAACTNSILNIKCENEKICKVLSVDIELKLINSNFLISSVFIETELRFNGIIHFLAQCVSEPWPTAVTAGTPINAPLGVPQGVIQMPLLVSLMQ